MGLENKPAGLPAGPGLQSNGPKEAQARERRASSTNLAATTAELFDLHQAWLTAVLTENTGFTQRDLAQQQVDAIRKRQKMGDATRSICCKSKPALAQAQPNTIESAELTRQAAVSCNPDTRPWPLNLPRRDIVQPPQSNALRRQTASNS